MGPSGESHYCKVSLGSCQFDLQREGLNQRSRTNKVKRRCISHQRIVWKQGDHQVRRPVLDSLMKREQDLGREKWTSQEDEILVLGTEKLFTCFC